MIQVHPNDVTPQVRASFDPGAPASLRCFAVLDGRAMGQIWVDALPSPAWGIVREAAFGSLYFGGAPDAEAIRAAIADLKSGGDVLIGLWPGDALRHVLPPDPDYAGSVLEFDQRAADDSLAARLETMPEGGRLRHLDRELFEHSRMAPYFLRVFGSIEAALERGIGLCLVRDGEILSEASAGPSANGLIEIGVETREQHQRRGYAAMVCAQLIQECEEQGLRTYWNCDAQNPASAALARKLGYRHQKEYMLVAWLR